MKEMGASLAEEVEIWKVLHAPVNPTAEMVDDRNVSHIPFLSGCSACMRGRAKPAGHGKAPDRDGDSIPVAAMDNGSLGCPGGVPTEGVGPPAFPSWSYTTAGLDPSGDAQFPLRARKCPLRPHVFSGT